MLHPFNKTFTFRFFWAVLYLVLFLFLTAAFNSSAGPDLGWHLSFGEQYLQSGRISDEQTYIWTLEGKSWVNHEWLSDIVMYRLFSLGGYLTLSIFFALITTLTLAALHFFIKDRLKAKSLLYFVWLLFGFSAINSHLGVRPQLFTFAFFTALLILLIKADKNSRYLWLAAPLIWFWSMMHASFLIGLIVLAIWSACRLLKKSKPPTAAWLAPLTALALTFISPYGSRLYIFLFKYATGNALNFIQEWKAVYLPPVSLDHLLFLSLTAAAAILAWHSRKLQTVPAWQIITLVLLFGLTIESVRQVTLLYAAATLFLLPMVAENLDSFKNEKIQRLFSTARLILGLFIIAMVVVWAPFFRPKTDPFTLSCERFPCQASDYLANRPELKDLRLLNYYNYGGYLIWRLPEWRLFIDGRLPQYPYEESSLMEEYIKLFDQEKIPQMFDKYNFELVIWTNSPEPKQYSFLDSLIATPATRPTSLNLIDFLDKSNDWQLLFKGPEASVYIKNSLIP